MDLQALRAECQQALKVAVDANQRIGALIVVPDTFKQPSTLQYVADQAAIVSEQMTKLQHLAGKAKAPPAENDKPARRGAHAPAHAPATSASSTHSGSSSSPAK
jgi:hypothetical protein